MLKRIPVVMANELGKCLSFKMGFTTAFVLFACSVC